MRRHQWPQWLTQWMTMAMAGACGAALAQTPAPPIGGVPASPGNSSGATITVASGPLKGDYGYSEPCVLASFSKRPAGLSVVMHGADSVLSIDMPTLDDQHAHEIQIVLVINDTHSGNGPSSVTYEIDTRPDSALEPFQKAERANKGTTGKATVTLTQKADATLVSFTGQTASGIKLDGSLMCKKV